MNETGLKEYLEQATSSVEVEALLERGKAFKHASPKTVRKWYRIANRKLSQFKKQ